MILCNSVGRCPLNAIRDAFVCSPETTQERSEKDPLCCTKDSQCALVSVRRL